MLKGIDRRRISNLLGLVAIIFIAIGLDPATGTILGVGLGGFAVLANLFFIGRNSWKYYQKQHNSGHCLQSYQRWLKKHPIKQYICELLIGLTLMLIGFLLSRFVP